MTSRTDYWREYKARWLDNPENRERQNEAQRRYRERHSYAIKLSEALEIRMAEARKLCGND
jgi:hypothetical protein